MKPWLGPLLSVFLLIGVGIAIYLSMQEQLLEGATVTVRGLIGSEKEEFFKDPRVIEVLQNHGLDVKIEKAGSREIATSFDLGQYDFAFPAGVPAAEKIRREQGIHKFYAPFFTPMAIASWKTVAEVLAANGIAEERKGYYTLNMAFLLKEIAEGRRWKDLADNPNYAVNKSILISSTDIRKSNSAAMYLALASFVANGNNVVQSDADITRVRPLMENLFLRQGFVEYSSEAPFEDYLVMGMGKAPLVMVYESQFVQRSVAEDGGIMPEMLLIYPKPTIFTKHILLPLSEAGKKLGEALETDPELQSLAIEYGFRNNNIQYFREHTRKYGVPVADNLVDVIEPPSYEVIEHMIELIDQRY